MRLFILVLFTLIPLSTTISLAHENQLSGLLYMQPQTPIPNEPFTITFELYDPEGKFIPNAILNLAIQGLSFKESFTETSQTGIYQLDLILSEGRWLTGISEETFENESNTVQFGLKVGEQNREIIEILFPVIKETPSQRAWIAFFFCLGIAGISTSLSYVYKLNSCKIKFMNKHKINV